MTAARKPTRFGGFEPVVRKRKKPASQQIRKALATSLDTIGQRNIYWIFQRAQPSQRRRSSAWCLGGFSAGWNALGGATPQMARPGLVGWLKLAVPVGFAQPSLPVSNRAATDCLAPFATCPLREPRWKFRKQALCPKHSI